jgi:hypothetical protein
MDQFHRILSTVFNNSIHSFNTLNHFKTNNETENYLGSVPTFEITRSNTEDLMKRKQVLNPLITGLGKMLKK